MNIVFWGTPNFCLPIFESIIKSKHNIVAVVTQPDRRRGRGKNLCYSPIKEEAIKHGIPVFTPNHIKLETNIQKV